MYDATKEAIILKFREIAARYAELRQTIASAEAELKKLEIKAYECHAASRLFGFDLQDVIIKRDNGSSFTLGTVTNQTVPKTLSKRPSIKELVLIEAQKAYPNPIRAANVRQTLEAIREEKLHEKTIGMTLYRLLKEGKLRREGWDWYFLKENT